MFYAEITYLLYIVLSLGITIWVGTTLFRNGRIFVIEAFNNNVEMGEAVNHLLLVGFYLVNIGFVSLFLRFGAKPDSAIEAIEYISTKMGVVLLILGAMHYFNVKNFGRMRSKALAKRSAEPAEPKVAPSLA